MREEILPDAASAARRAADIIAEIARNYVAAQGRFILAVSGGSTPESMLRYLAEQDVPWSRVHLFQVDERAVPRDDPARNLDQLRRSLLERLPVTPAGVYPMPVEDDLELAARTYAQILESVAGDPPVLDLVQLGLGEDGHTASLFADGPSGDSGARDVAAIRPTLGWARVTLTYRVINRAHGRLWLVTGARKAAALRRLRAADEEIVGSRVRRTLATVVSDRAASAMKALA